MVTEGDQSPQNGPLVDQLDDFFIFDQNIRINLCKHTVEQLGGEIWANSKHKEGTDLIFTSNISMKFIKDQNDEMVDE